MDMNTALFTVKHKTFVLTFKFIIFIVCQLDLCLILFKKWHMAWVQADKSVKQVNGVQNLNFLIKKKASMILQ